VRQSRGRDIAAACGQLALIEKLTENWTETSIASAGIASESAPASGRKSSVR